MNSFIAGSVICPGPPNREPTDSIARNDCVYTRQLTQWHATDDVIDKAPGELVKTELFCIQQSVYEMPVGIRVQDHPFS